ncbi:MAG: hypothetical protein QXH42_07135 [Thermoplasmata archaeon]
MRRAIAAAGAVAVVVVALALALALLPSKKEGGSGGHSEPALMVNGREMRWESLEKLEKRVVSGTEGVALSAIINSSGVATPRNHQYRLIASDGYAKNVTWDDMMEGIVVRVGEVGNNTLKTVFPSLPKRYSVRGLVEIQVIKTDTLQVCGREYTWEQPFDNMFESVSIHGFNGVRLSDIVNHSGLTKQAQHTYTLIAGDGYNITVGWGDMLSGALVLDGHRTVFGTLPAEYYVTGLIEIQAIPSG